MDISIFGHDACAGAGASPTALVRFRRAPDEFSDEHFGLTLAEAKNILAEIQKLVVQRQAAEYIQVSRFCRRCGAVLAIREVRTRKIQTLFGVVEIEAPRLARCRCAAAQCGWADRFSPIADALPERTTRELRLLHAELGARHSFREASDILSTFLPSARFNHASVRNRLSKVAEEIALGLSAANAMAANDNDAAPDKKPGRADEIVVVIDGAHIPSSSGRKWRTIDVTVGKVESPHRAPRRFGFAVAGDRNPLGQIRAALRSRSWRPCMPVAVISDGEAALPNLVTAAAGPNIIHILDWWHVSAKVRHVETALKSLLHIEPRCDMLYGYASFYVNRLRHLIWNGYGPEAGRALFKILGRDPILPDKAGIKFYSAEFLRKCRELRSYLRLNETSLINYGRRYRAGMIISTSRAESCVEEIANARMAKKRRMRWSPRGAHCVAVVRSAVLDGRLMQGEFTRRAA